MVARELVHDALDKATDNGFEFEAWTFLEVAQDLVTHDSQLEDESAEEIAPIVKEWFLSSDVVYRMYDA